MSKQNEKFLPSLRVTVFVPVRDVENYIRNVQDSIPAFLGHYDRVLWISDPSVEPGMEQFRPLKGSNPVQGGSGDTVREPSCKIEFSVPDDQELCEKLIEDVLAPMHPWEAPVILVQESRIYNAA